MDKSLLRWTEIQFLYLCLDLYDQFRNYISVTAYIELLADIASVDKNTALRLLQKMNQVNNIRPTNIEYMGIAKKFNQPYRKIIKILHISKDTYLKYKEQADSTLDFYPRCSLEEIESMSKLLEIHHKIQGIGI